MIMIVLGAMAGFALFGVAVGVIATGFERVLDWSTDCGRRFGIFFWMFSCLAVFIPAILAALAVSVAFGSWIAGQ